MTPESAQGAERSKQPRARGGRGCRVYMRDRGNLTPACETLQPRAPAFWVPARMDAPDDLDQLGRGDIEKRVRKAAQQRAAGVLVHFLIGFRIPLDGCQACFNRPQELGSKPGTLFLVPAIRRLDVVFSGWAKDQWSAHRLPSSLAFTSDQGLPTPGFAA
jgi:hypothetical protein